MTYKEAWQKGEISYYLYMEVKYGSAKNFGQEIFLRYLRFKKIALPEECHNFFSLLFKKYPYITSSRRLCNDSADFSNNGAYLYKGLYPRRIFDRYCGLITKTSPREFYIYDKDHPYGVVNVSKSDPDNHKLIKAFLKEVK